MLFFFAVLKKRLVKLVVNFLFYFRTDEAEPIGALLLEHCRITKEEENVFSISFIEEPERKYCFECDSEQQCQEWIEALKRASYEFMRRSLIFYRNEIQKMTGKVSTLQLAFQELVISGVAATHPTQRCLLICVGKRSHSKSVPEAMILTACRAQ
ncbi:pleckstrin homology domain-containing family J member 1 isoform X1 [Apteryx rowi]|uniref:pleckstrin homology domain-containing family J member 1 isoform X1 n=1 Tax=Apteryx rowi TaxID=308060 RepID=UPI000E1D8665|nr:pleckstrin homology domain-containing family J member 1 isoform X1 [Apteryx rowi]